jgi:hypothetical protein
LLLRHCDQTTGALTEQFNRDTGIMQGATDLTWSYAAVLTAFRHRALAKKAAERIERQPALVRAVPPDSSLYVH